jgi:hypothetical protein
MEQGQRSGSFRYATSIAIFVVMLALLGCGALTLLPRQSDNAGEIKSLKDLASAYARVQPGLTRASQLAALGFDTATPNVEVLSYFGVMERFMPRDSTSFDRLNTAIKDCIIEARDRCTAIVMTAGDGNRSHGGGVLAAIGFGPAAAAAQVPEVTLLVQNGRVAYKMISGMPQAAASRHIASSAPPPRAAAVIPVAYRALY